jgi:hypothetical protein
MATLPLASQAVRVLAGVAVAAATAIVLVDFFGLDPFDNEGRATRLPAEYLYLDDERVDAYLGQLHGGVALSEQRSRSVTRSRQARASASQVVQVGGSVQQQEASSRRCRPRRRTVITCSRRS